MPEKSPALLCSKNYLIFSTLIIDTKTLQVKFDLRSLCSGLIPKYIVETSPNYSFVILDECHSTVTTFKITESPPVFQISADILGQTYSPPWFSQTIWFDDCSNRINQISRINERGNFCFGSMSLCCEDRNTNVYDFHNFAGQSIGNHHHFKVCLQPLYITSFSHVIFAIFYYKIGILQICITDSLKDQQSGQWVPTLQFLDIENIEQYWDIFEGPGGQLLIRLSKGGKQIVQIYDCPQVTVLGLQTLQCIGTIDVEEIPNFYHIYPITCKFDEDLNLIYSSYFFSSYIEFIDKYEHLSVIKCRRTKDGEDSNRSVFNYDITSFPPSRYMTPQEMADNWQPVLIKNLSYLPEAQIPKCFCVIKKKVENGKSCRYAVQIKSLPKCLK